MRLYELHQNILQGYFPPRWEPNMVGGFGYPFFDFYAPFSYWLAEIFHLLGFGLIWSVKLTFFVGIFISGLGMYLLVLNLFKHKLAALASALVYMTFPYHLIDIYTRGNLAEATVFAILPFCLLAFYKLIKEPQIKYLILSGFTLALIFLTHNITGLYFLPILIAWLVFWVAKTKNWSKFHLVLIALLVGFLLSAFFVVPALLDKKFVRTEDMIQLWTLPLSFIFSNIGKTENFDFLKSQTTTWQWLLVLISFGSVFFVKRVAKYKSLIIFLTALLLIIIFFVSNWSKFIWDSLPNFFLYIQYSYRLLIFFSFLFAILIGFSIKVFEKQKIIIFLILLLVAFFVFKDSYRFRGLSYSTLRDKNITPQFSWNWDKTWGPLGNTAQSEYLPTWVSRDKFDHRTDGEGKLNYEKDFNLQTAQEISFNTIYFPGWKAKINGQSLEIKTDDNGFIQVLVPAGPSRVEVYFSETPLRLACDLISLVTVIVCLALLGLKIGKN